MTKSPHRRPHPRKVLLAAVLGAAVLGGGTGMAYAADAPDQVVETGYAAIVDDNCPDDGETEGTGAL